METRIKKMSTKKLKEEFEALDQAIEDVDCYGVRDLMLREAISNELHRRTTKTRGTE